MNFETLYINGQWVPSVSGKFIEVENPATMQKFARVPAGNAEDVDKAAKAAKKAFPTWANAPMAERISLMKKMLAYFKELEPQIAEAVMKELGAPISFATSNHTQYQYVRTQSYIDLAADLPIVEKLAQSTVYRRPLGVIGCITPWNYPLGQIVQKVIPAILVGCTVVLKPSQHTPLTAYYLTEAFDKAGFPAGVFNLVTGRGSEIGNAMCDNKLIDMISFTGSTEAGIGVSQRALGTMKRISMELGGKSPYVFLKSDDYEPAVRMCFNSIFLNAGQTCTALSRLIIPKEDKAKIEAIMQNVLPEYTVGDPTDPTVKIGPMSSRNQYDTVKGYIQKGIDEGATLFAGSLPDAPNHGYYVKPTIFTDVTNDMTIAQEEIFGPVLCVIAYDTVEEAVQIANDTVYGLNAAVWGPKDQAIAVGQQIFAGNVYINEGPRDVTAPFGGFKESGIGRESGKDGMLEFTEPQALFDHI